MLVEGKQGEARIFAKKVEEQALRQIYEITNHPMAKDSKIRIMPDVHAGKGCVIGTTMTIKDMVVPNYVGVDIGCGVYMAKVNAREDQLKELDRVTRRYIPAGRNVRKSPAVDVDLSALRCEVDLNRARLSVGTLGGGNHFIELNESRDGYYLSVHSGSRYFGKQVCDYYQRLAIKSMKKYKGLKLPRHSAFLTDQKFQDYINDMRIAQAYAKLNRQTIIKIITEKMNWDVYEEFDVIHNYIDTRSMILRKGAISAQKGEKVAIPINMRDGIIIGIGKGNPDWNYSAPHGAGRLMSRSKAKKVLDLNEFRKSMKGVFSTSVNRATLDEAPMSYKPAEEIIAQTKDTIELIEIARPVYSFKG
ncbi:MAG TPA: RtcB family protein [Clostridia bacterium]|nr:RtcB family protein [Clostridia bacterium]